MAELNQRLHVKKNGVTEEIKCYTTLAEVQYQGVPLKLGGVNCYAKYGSASDVNASQLNYKIPSGGGYRVLKQAQVSYGEQAYTTPGTYTFTVPSGVTKVKVALCGGGTGHNGSAASLGGASSFGAYLSAPTNDTKELNNSNISIGYKLSFDGAKETQAYTGYGHGGSASMGKLQYSFRCSNFAVKIITTRAGETIACVVGAGGAGYKNNYYTFREGGDGFVLIAWGGDIQ